MVATVLNTAYSLGSFMRRGTAISAESVGQPYAARGEFYALQESYYQNDVYERHNWVQRHATAFQGMPRYMRSIYSPVRRAVDWWPGHLYPGVWTPDGLPTKGGKPNRIPYDDTPEDLRLALQAAFTWGGWNSEVLVYARRLALLGDCFGEVAVDLERRKVYPRLVHPAHVVDIAENAAGDVTSYRLAIPMRDERDQPFTWGKLVTKETITTFYNDQPKGYDDQPAETENPYGFAPGDWVQFRNLGGKHGATVIDGLHGKIDELNGVLTAINDYIMRFVHQKIIIGTDDPADLRNFLAGSGGAKAGATRDLPNPNAGRESQPVLAAKNPVSAHRILENMGLAEADSHVQRLIDQLEKDLPELTISEKLLDMQQVTKPGALPLVQDVQHLLDEVAGNADRGLIKLGQMSVAIMGFELRAGNMGRPSEWTEAQRRFLPFGLESFDRGELAFSLAERELVPDSMLDKINEAVALQALDRPSSYRHVGFSEKDIFGEGNEPEQPAGLLEERESAAGGTADILARAFNSGGI